MERSDPPTYCFATPKDGTDVSYIFIDDESSEYFGVVFEIKYAMLDEKTSSLNYEFIIIDNPNNLELGDEFRIVVGDIILNDLENNY